MSTQDSTPHSRVSLAADLRGLGIKAGDILFVHSSLSSLGWVIGGAVAVLQALQDVVTEQGTLMLPAQSGDLSDPANWHNPAVPESWWPTIRENLPAFDPASTPTRGLGVIPELFRTWPHVRRSHHPHNSYAAWGKYAAYLTDNHQLDFSMGEGSPLARFYELDGYVLQLGTHRNSSLHLAEVRAGLRPVVERAAPIMHGGERRWVTFQDIAYDDATFPPIKAAFEAKGSVKLGKVGAATTKLMRQRELVDFAVQTWTQ